MATTLSPSGLSKPASPDTGATFWAALAAVIQALNDHTHSNADSSPIVKTQAISGASWGADLGGGKYRQTITLSGSLLYDSINISFRDGSGYIVYPTVEKVSSTSYYVYSNNSALAMTAIYT